MATVEDCTVDQDAIAAHFQANLSWNFIPFLGPILGQVASPKLPEDYQEELTKENGNLSSEIDLWREAITTLSISNTDNLDTLVNLIPSYVTATATLIGLPDSIKINTILVQVIVLSILMAIVIFLGL